MRRITSFHLSAAMLCSLLIACAGEPTSPQAALTPQFSKNDNNGVGQGKEHEPFPDLEGVARFRGTPPTWSAHDNHTVISQFGGVLSVGGFTMWLPPGAVDRPTQFHIVLPVDPKEKARATAQFGPHYTFNKNIIVELPYRSTDALSPQIVWWNGRAWEKIPSWPCGFDVCGLTNHFSVYAVWKGVIALGG